MKKALAVHSVLAGSALALSFHTAYARPTPPEAACAALISAGLPDTTISLAQVNPASGSTPAHCEVIGAINERVSPIDGQTYAIKFRLRMPLDWNRRFFYSGGGGADGNLGSATGPQLDQGYAVVSTDSGHDNASNVSEVAGNYEFGFDPQARSDYGYNGPGRVTVAAKALIEAFYGHRPKYSYFVGCSEGGREGVMLSQRYPDFFDGIVAGNPGLDLPKAAVAEAWDSQAFARAATSTTPFGNPDLASSFTNAQLAIVGQAIATECDAQDGLADGMLFNPSACHFDPATLGPTGTGQLSQAQVTALEQVFGGARNSQGEPLYAGWFWDPGIAAGGWRVWKIGPLFPAPGNSALNVTLGGGALPFIFTTPPNSMTGGTDLASGTTILTATPVPGLPPSFGDAFVPWVLSFNMDSDAPKIYERSGVYQESAMDFMGTGGTDYKEFSKHGKLIVYSGQADPVFSSKYHIEWYEQVAARNGGFEHTQKFARLFLFPGMNHCGGGPATSQFDAFAAMVRWVEKNEVPESLLGTAPDGTPWPGRTRPICAYPAWAHYRGHGEIEDAASFRCKVH